MLRKAIATQTLIFLILLVTFVTLSIPSLIKEIEINRTTTTTTLLEAKYCRLDNDCVLHICGCECYSRSFSEKYPPPPCYDDCEKDFGVIGCECINNQCQRVYSTTTTITGTECNTEQDCISSGKCDPGLECTCYQGKCYRGHVAGTTTTILSLAECIRNLEEQNKGKEFSDTSIIVIFKEGTSKQERQTIVKSFDLSIISNYDFAVAAVRVPKGEVFEWICRLQAHEDVTSGSPNYIEHAT